MAPSAPRSCTRSLLHSVAGPSTHPTPPHRETTQRPTQRPLGGQSYAPSALRMTQRPSNFFFRPRSGRGGGGEGGGEERRRERGRGSARGASQRPIWDPAGSFHDPAPVGSGRWVTQRPLQRRRGLLEPRGWSPRGPGGRRGPPDCPEPASAGAAARYCRVRTRPSALFATQRPPSAPASDGEVPRGYENRAPA